MSVKSIIAGIKEAAKAKQLESRKRKFAQGMTAGADLAARVIIKHSAKCCKAVQESPVGELAVNVDETIRTFVADENSEFLRFSPLAKRIMDLVQAEKEKEITVLDNPDKLERLGKAFGFMSGTAVMTSVTNIFLKQAMERLGKTELSEDAKNLCLSYINDAFTLVLMALTGELDKTYSLPVREKKLFADILRRNEWADIPRNEPAESAPEPEKSSE